MSSINPPEPPRQAAIGRTRFHVLAPTARTVRLWIWAAVAGALAAAATMGFRWLTQQVERLATGHTGGLVEAALSLPPWHRALVCAVGGLLAGLALHVGGLWAARGKRGNRNLDYIDAARAGRVDLNDRTTLTRTLSALISVGTGASIGREGPMVQLAAWLGARLARVVAIDPEQRNAIMVCGIAAGIGSAYHAPVAGVVFVLELALGFFARHTVAPVLIASATASSLIYWLVEPKPLYAMPSVVMAPTSLGIALLAGIVFGGLGWGLLTLLEKSKSWFSHIGSLPLRLGLGGVLVGLLSAGVPQVWGNGYSVVSDVLQGGQAWQWLALVLLTKVAATALSSGSGAIGGVFTPSLFVGATAGSVIAQVASLWLPAAWVGDPRVLAVLGMAAVLSAVTHAPLMAIVMVLEMTNQFQLTVPVMLACGVAYAISTQFGVKPLYGNPIEGPR
ncbi:chloride channel protein [Variovorax sp. PBL-E5]|uniref:chloride channel protein n=1 Tax=Variovorax sp. PBL-E5 TaxID=434014 RepID=UPI0013194B35|nr:chloride channel protein [Variovorax sp. PBL-E5]VTU35752.1 Voltage-gated ClC-type chloride channel ClcB [Variovorax sp. PBL-E5]